MIKNEKHLLNFIKSNIKTTSKDIIRSKRLTSRANKRILNHSLDHAAAPPPKKKKQAGGRRNGRKQKSEQKHKKLN